MSQPMGPDATTALNRFGLGARFDLSTDQRNVIAHDPKTWAKAQLFAENPLLQSANLNDTQTNLLNDIAEQQQKKAMRDAVNGLAYPGMTNPVALYASAQNGPQQATVMAPPAMMNQAAKQPPLQQQILQAETAARYQKAFDDPSGLVERLVWFWSNHFAVSIAKGQQVTVSAGSFEREAIRPHVLGKFADMLKAVEQHPTMLFYLDNRDSVGPNSKNGQRSHKGLNENLAREILELHTLGVGGGYAQADVTNFARIITGWSWVGPNNPNFEPARFMFNPNTHEPGAFPVLGKIYSESGIAQGEVVLTDVAQHPSTAKHLAMKFARHFVSDDPPPALVDKLAKNFLSTGGDLKTFTETLLDDDQAWAAPHTKIRTPQEFLMAASRALNLPPNQPQPLLRALNDLGQPLWKPSGPNGFGDRVQDWAAPEGMKMRLAYASLMARQAAIAGNPIDLANVLFGDAASPETRQAISRAESKAQGLALLLMSPEFQRR